MKRACVVVLDAARARICLYQEQAKPGFELTEYRDLASPGRRMKEGDMFSESRPATAQQGGFRKRGWGGGDKSTFGTPGGTYDDHRGAHIDEMDAKFIKEVVETLQHVLADKQMGHLIVCAPPRMLGMFRQTADFEKKGNHQVDELSIDISQLSLPQIHDQLASRGLIPPRARLAMAR